MLRMLVILIPLVAYCAQAQWVINGVSYDADGRSEQLWTDDGSYGIATDNYLSSDGDIRILEYAKVSDSNFPRYSFLLNTPYTLDPLTSALVANGVATNAATAEEWYSRRLSSGGYLNPAYGWFLVDNSNGTFGIVNNGDVIFGEPLWKVPVVGDYAVVETKIRVLDPSDYQSSTDLLTDGHVVNGVLLNANNEPYLQIVFQDDNQWNLRSISEDGYDDISSIGIGGHALGVGAIRQTTNGTSVAWLLDYGMPDESADVDNDGFQTLEEYIAGTDPTNGFSFFQIGISSSGIQIPSVSNRLYTVESCDSLAVSNRWETVTNVFPNSGITITVPLDTNRFYRVHVSLP